MAANPFHFTITDYPLYWYTYRHSLSVQIQTVSERRGGTCGPSPSSIAQVEIRQDDRIHPDPDRRRSDLKHTASENSKGHIL